MKKYGLVIVLLIIVVVVVGYLGRHQIKSLLGMTQSSYTTSPQNAYQAPASTTTSNSNNIYLTKTNPAKGDYLTDFQGMSLYIFDKDTNGTSTCYNGCATVWPAYTSGATSQGSFPTGITVITRTDGSKQFAWKGMPLYYYSGDKAAGDVNGDGIQGVWHLAKP